MSNNNAKREVRNLLKQGYDAANRKEHRRAADKFLQAWNRSPSKWEPNRYSALAEYSQILVQMYFKPTQSDLDTLQRIVKDRRELIPFRANAALALGTCRWYDHRKDEAGDLFRDAIGFKQELNNKEVDYIFTVSVADSDNRSGFAIAHEIATMAQQRLDQLVDENKVTESSSNKFVRTEKWVREDGTPLPENGRQMRFSIGPQGNSLTRTEIRKLLSVGGEYCDSCGRKRTEMGVRVDHFQCCGVCMRAYYCSQNCQRNAWLSGHREHCREVGEIKVGDYVVIRGLQKKPQLNGEVVVIQDRTQNGRWAVRKPGQENNFSVADDRLHPLRPLK